MKKESDYYDFANYEGIEKENNYKKIMQIVTIFIISITIILIIVTRNMQVDLEENEDIAEQTIKQSQLEEEKNQAELKEKEETKKQEEIKKKREAKLPKLTDVGRENMKHIYSSDSKRAFLTFDDGPSSVTPQILDTLKEQKVKATFFVLGSNVETFPDTIKRIYKEGHYIANHGYTHTYSSIYSSPQAVLDEFNRCNEAVQKVLGESEYNSHLFRFPGGLPGGKYADLKQEAKQLLEDNDILNVDWNALTGDAESQKPVAEKLMNNLKTTTGEKMSVVILMHDAQAKKVTADMLPDIIAYLREQGYEFKTFYDIIK